MYYDGLLIRTDYLYDRVAYFDGVDPDLFSMLELNKMVELLNIEWEFFQFLTIIEGREIEEGLTLFEGKSDIFNFTVGLLDDVNVVKVHLK